MKAVIQRVSHARVTVQDEQDKQITTGEIQQGLMVLIGIGPNDTEKEAVWLAKKLVGLRVFEDEQQKMNLSVIDVGGSILAISQFTLYGDCKKRPDLYGDQKKIPNLYGGTFSKNRICTALKKIQPNLSGASKKELDLYGVIDSRY